MKRGSQWEALDEGGHMAQGSAMPGRNGNGVFGFTRYVPGENFDKWTMPWFSEGQFSDAEPYSAQNCSKNRARPKETPVTEKCAFSGTEAEVLDKLKQKKESLGEFLAIFEPASHRVHGEPVDREQNVYRFRLLYSKLTASDRVKVLQATDVVGTENWNVLANQIRQNEQPSRSCSPSINSTIDSATLTNVQAKNSNLRPTLKAKMTASNPDEQIFNDRLRAEAKKVEVSSQREKPFTTTV